MNLIDALAEFDGRHVGPLEEVAERCAGASGACDELLIACHSDVEKLQVAASWVLKRLLEQAVELSEGQTRELLKLLGRVSVWEAELHLLQAMDYLRVPSRGAKIVFDTVENKLISNQKFVRAWAYSGVALIADQHPRFRDRAALLLAKSDADEAASVRARVRQIRKSFPWAKNLN